MESTTATELLVLIDFHAKNCSAPPDRIVELARAYKSAHEREFN